MSRHLDPDFWSEVMRESRIAVIQIARDATESGTFDPTVVGTRVNEIMSRYDSVEEQAAVMNLWALSAIGALASTFNDVAKNQGYASFAEMNRSMTLKDLADDE